MGERDVTTSVRKLNICKLATRHGVADRAHPGESALLRYSPSRPHTPRGGDTSPGPPGRLSACDGCSRLGGFLMRWASRTLPVPRLPRRRHLKPPAHRGRSNSPMSDRKQHVCAGQVCRSNFHQHRLSPSHANRQSHAHGAPAPAATGPQSPCSWGAHKLAGFGPESTRICRSSGAHKLRR